ncbi:MAG: hypothetical protein KC731_09750 [Myxococcales bacterium]|nr:hypothetical protein [Myxococcales bacterium]
MTRLLAIGMACGLMAAALSNQPANAADEATFGSDAVQLDEDGDEKDGKCETEGRFIKGLKGACDEGGTKAAKKLMKKLTKDCKDKVKDADGAKEAAKMNCAACHPNGGKDHTKLKGGDDGVKAIMKKCEGVFAD